MGFLRAFYAVLAAAGGLNALWMLGDAPGWYARLPAAVPDTGPLNIHFVHDIGIAYLAASVLAAVLAIEHTPGRAAHLGLTVFYAGHALSHIIDISTGRLPPSHWMLDAVPVLLPGIVLGFVALPPVWRQLTATRTAPSAG